MKKGMESGVLATTMVNAMLPHTNCGRIQREVLETHFNPLPHNLYSLLCDQYHPASKTIICKISCLLEEC